MPALRSIIDPKVRDTINDAYKRAKNGSIKDSSNGINPSPEAWEDQFIYFLLCDRFSDGKEKGGYRDNKGDPVASGSINQYEPRDLNSAVTPPAVASTWADAGKNFVGGTIKGIKSKLGYLKRLGVTAVWISPIFKNCQRLQTYHGYGVQNFLDIDPRFGTKEELKDLVKTAHGMGMYVILDIIMNHSGNVFRYEDPKERHFRDSHGQKFPVKGFYNENDVADIPFPSTDDDITKLPIDAAIWPHELQEAGIFTCEGQIDSWDNDPEYLDGDFFDLKDFALGPDSPDGFVATRALKVLTDCYKYWIAYADIDGYRLDTVKHMGFGPTRYFAGAIHEFAMRIGKENFMIVGEITGSRAFETVEATGLDAALGIGGVMQSLWQLPRGGVNAMDYFSQFRNANYNQDDRTWLRSHVFTMLDDHDQVWRGEDKQRFCAYAPGRALVLPAVALNLCTLGTPCIYYGTEQQFNGHGGKDDAHGYGADMWIREAMFGGGFGAFCTSGLHCFNEDGAVYKGIAAVSKIRDQEITLRRGRQYLREISGDGNGWGYPTGFGSRMLSIVPWSRVFDGTEILCATNTDESQERSAWVTVDYEIQTLGKKMQCLYPPGMPDLTVERKKSGGGERSVVLLTLPPAAFAIFK